MSAVDPLRRGTALWRAVPRLRLPACKRCQAGQRQGVAFDAAVGAVQIALTSLAMVGLLLLWPWISAGWLGLAALVVVALVTLASRRIGAGARLASRVGVAAWARAGQHEAELALQGPGQAQRIGAGVRGARIAPCSPRWGGLWATLGAAFSVLAVPMSAIRLASASVAMLQAGDTPLEVFVDGRSYGVLVGLRGEDPGALRFVRVPRGTRVFEARALDGALVDRTVGGVGHGAAQIYVPITGGRCFWLERRAYGQPAPGVRVRPIRPGGSFITLDEPVDAWLDPTPDADGLGRWFSGGSRTSLRHGECGGVPGLAP